MISVKDLHVSLARKMILNNISFQLIEGDNLVILGRSGSGKTVLIKTLLGIYPPDAGTINVDGYDLYSCSQTDFENIKRSFAMVFQHAALLDSFSVFQNVALPLYERGCMSEAAIETKVNYCLSMVGLENTRNLYPSQLSGGMKKRIGIARALVYDPKYVIFDEPVSGLDPITAAETVYYMKEIMDHSDRTFITITHDISTIPLLGRFVLFIDKGVPLFFGQVEDIYNSTNETIRRYFS